jgi:hypothetical protein
MSYALQRWDKLKAYLHNGMLGTDNKRIENAIRSVALGRKNYLFAGAHAGAERAAMFYTFDPRSTAFTSHQPYRGSFFR